LGSKQRERRRRPARRTATLSPRRRILVVCEGQNTEPGYIEGFRQWRRNPLVIVEVSKEHGVPRTLVELAKTLKREAANAARRERDENLSYDEVSCVFDVDDHPKLDEARQMAIDNEIELAVSNPCFELWLLLHFRESPGMQHRHDLQKMMKPHVPRYDKSVDFERFSPNYESARLRATRLQRVADEDGDPHRNPTTGVYRLTESIGRRDHLSESNGEPQVPPPGDQG
jgi:hypothetical protein